MFSIVAVGSFNEWASAAVSVLLLCFLLYKAFENKSITIGKDLLNLSVALICVFYFITSAWAIDGGMAIIGGIKFLPLILFLLARKQESCTPSQTYQMVIYTTSIMVVLSSVISFVPPLAGYVTVAGRLAGFFQYPNTFAMLILISELLILYKPKFKIFDLVLLLILIFGLLYTGSRMVFVLFLLSNACIVFTKANKKTRLLFLGGLAMLLAIIFIGFGSSPLLQRFLRISIFESTFVGRILYAVDAAPLLLKYPFGMGYLGYNYIHPTIQTGLYTVRYVHNDFLQLVLDIGWLPVAFFVAAITKKVFSKATSIPFKIIIITFCAHIFFDFDLQFIAMFLLLLVLLEEKDTKNVTLKAKGLLGGAAVVLLVANTYMCMHLLFAHFHLGQQAQKLYPWNTENHIAMIEKESNLAKANALADRILVQNNMCYAPYVIKANAAYAAGEFNNVITYSRQLIQQNPFEAEHYENYARMLINGIAKYNALGDQESIAFCQNELKSLQSALRSLPARLSDAGAKIKDQPQTEFSQEIQNYLNELG